MTTTPNIRIVHGDALTGMAALPDQSIDLVLSDPPYGITDCTWDRKPDLKALWAQWCRLLRPRGAIILTATFKFALEVVKANPNWFRYDLVWEKSRPVGFLNAKKMPMRNHELILVFYAKTGACESLKVPAEKRHASHRPQGQSASRTYAIRGPKAENFVWVDDGLRHPKSVLHFDSVPNPMHPTQKPLALFEWLMRAYSRPGARVLDPYLGSGTTAVAAAKLGREFVGFELLSQYVDLARLRLAELENPPPVFVGPLGEISLN